MTVKHDWSGDGVAGVDNGGYVMDSYTAYNNNYNVTNPKDNGSGSGLTQEQIKKEKRGIYKNVLLISVAFLLLFVAFESMSKLQSSINVVNNLGTFANAAVYGSLIISCMFLPTILINWLKVKWTLVVCVLCYSTYIGAQFYPEFYTLIPTAFIVGLGAAPMWSAKCTYLTQVAHRFAVLDGVDPEPVVVKFFGIFFFFFQCNSIVGQFISTVVLSSGNATIADISSVDFGKCGSNYCPDSVFSKISEVEEDISNAGYINITEEVNKNFERDDAKIYILATVFLCCSVAASIIIAIFVDPLSKYGEDERNEEKPKLTGVQLLLATFRHMKNPYQVLLIPITFWSGIEQSFFGADFLAGYVTCAFGVHMVGRVVICYGVFDSLSSVLSGFVIKFVGRIPTFLFGAGVNLICLIVMLTASFDESSLPIVFVLGALWGIGDAIWQTQINALYGCLFVDAEEAAFSNYRLWESFGFFLGFLVQGFGVCVFPKLFTTLVFLGLGIVGYLAVEVMEWKKPRTD